MHPEDPAEKSVENAGITSGNKPSTTSESQTQHRNEEADSAAAGVGDENGDRHEAVTIESALVVKRGRGRPRKTTDKARVDDDDTSAPNSGPETARTAETEDEDDSKIWGIESHKRGLEMHETTSSPLDNVAKRGRGRPSKLNEANTVVEQLSTPNSATKRGRGRPRKSDSNVAVDGTAAGLSNTNSLRRSGRPKKAFFSESTITKGQQQVDRSVARKDDSTTEDTEEDNEKEEKTEEGKGPNEGKSQVQEEPEAKRYDVHKASFTPAIAGTKRKRDVPKVQDNSVDILSSTKGNMFRPAILRYSGQPREAEVNMSHSASNPISSIPRDFENDLTAEKHATHGSTKRPKLLPPPESPAPHTGTDMGTPSTGFQTPSQLTAFRLGTGIDGSHATHDEHAAMNQAGAAIQNLRDTHETLITAETSPRLPLTRVTGPNPAQASQPAQNSIRPSGPGNRINNDFIESPGVFVFTSSTVTFGDVSGSGDDMPYGLDSALDGSRFSDVMDMVPFPSVVSTDTGSYYETDRGGVVAPIARMLTQDGWSEHMTQLSENHDVE